MKLSDLVQDPSTKAKLVEDCTHLIDQQVTSKKGMSGLALKTAYRVVKGIGPRYLPAALGRLLPDAFAALDPLWQEGVQTGDPVEHLIARRSEAAEILLSVTDARLHKTEGLVRSSYLKIRQSVKADIAAAIPELATLLEAHLATGQPV